MEQLSILRKLKKLNLERCESETGFNHKLDSWGFAQWSNAVAGETGELCNKVKKLERGDVIDRLDIANEVGDIVIYLDLFCQRMGLDLQECVELAFNHKSEEIGHNKFLSEFIDYEVVYPKK